MFRFSDGRYKKVAKGEVSFLAENPVVFGEESFSVRVKESRLQYILKLP